MPTYSDAEMRAIMGRALQIDSGRSERFTPEQLRTIAAELGISVQALEVAMYEADSNGGVAKFGNAPMHPRSRWARGVAVAAGVLLVLAGAFALMRLKPAPMVERAAPAAPVAGEGIGAARAGPLPTRATPVARAPEPVPVKTKTTKKTAVPPQF